MTLRRMISRDVTVRLWTALSLILVVPLGLSTKHCRVDGLEWVRESSGGALYVVFFCLSAFFIWPRARAWLLAAAVLSATCCVELLQLWHPRWLETIRATTAGGLVLGSTFVWGDFPWYVVGAGLGWGWMSFLGRRFVFRTGEERASAGDEDAGR